jgi:hypothetical protein|tara:strand:- start:1621 stop:3045 length:1425 start_codon:yes stop_codon:yes gene_type:complete
MLNPYFQQGARTEQNLLQDLINEQLKMYGVEVHYLPRKYVTEKSVIREVIQSSFDDAYPIEAYVENVDGYGDNPTLLSKFGIQATNELNLIISKERWENYIQPLIKNETNIKLSTRPKEGDLVYFPLGDRLFEIKYVEHERPFYQLQKNYVYELRCELFRLEDELIDTGIDDIDDVLVGGELTGETEDGISTLTGPSQTLTLVGTGVTATAVISVFNGGIQKFVVSNRGSNYSSLPRVAISSAPSTGTTGIGTAVFIGGIRVCTDNLNPALKSVQQVDIINPGAGYTTPPSVQFIGGGGAGAAATAVINTGVVGLATLTNAGAGYTVNPTITISGVSTVSAAATAIVNSAGAISAIHFTNSGAGYTVAPTITIANPDLDSTGDFAFNEVVTGSVTGTTARVKRWDSTTNELEIYKVGGDFTVGENIVGSTSGASHQLRVISTDPPDDGFADNVNIETEADSILDFSEQNPFGIP